MKLSRDIVKDLFRGDKSGRVGLVCDFWDETIPSWLAQGYPVDDDGSPVHPAEHFNLDMLCAGGWFDWKCRPGIHDVLEENKDSQTFRDGNGVTRKQWKLRSGTSEKISFSMNSFEEWQKCRACVVCSAEKRVDKEVINTTRVNLKRWREKGKWTFYGHQFLWENMRDSFGEITLCEKVMNDRAWASDYCSVYTDLYKEAFTLLIDSAGKPDGIWLYEDLGYNNATFCSPGMYEEILFPFYSEITDFFHRLGMAVVMHSCGFVETIAGMMADAGIDGLHPLEVNAGNDPLKMAGEIGDKMVLIGGFDTAILETGDRERIRKAVEDIVKRMRYAGARYVFCPSSPISPKVRYDDFRYALDVFRECASPALNN